MAPASRHSLSVDGRPPSRRLAGRITRAARVDRSPCRGRLIVTGPGSYTHGQSPRFPHATQAVSPSPGDNGCYARPMTEPEIAEDDVKALLTKLLDVAEVLRETKAPKLFLTDAELIRRLGVPEKIARQALSFLNDKDRTFPKKSAFWGNRRYWPAVELWLQNYFCVITLPPGRLGPPDGGETSPVPRRPRI